MSRVQLPVPKGLFEDDPALERSRMTIGDHLEELRRRVFYAVVIVFIAFIPWYVAGEWLLEGVTQPLYAYLDPEIFRDFKIIMISPQEAFLTYLKVAFIAAVLTTSPIWVSLIWGFVAAGLYTREKKWINVFGPASFVMFVGGVAFLYFVVMPWVMSFLITFWEGPAAPRAMAPSTIALVGTFDGRSTRFTQAEWSFIARLHGVTIHEVITRDTDLVIKGAEHTADPVKWAQATASYVVRVTETDGLARVKKSGTSVVQRTVSLGSYVTFFLWMSILMGLVFQTPLVQIFLALVGIVSPATFAAKRRFVIAGAVIVAALLTPPDVVSQLLTAGPFIILYECGIWIGRLVYREKPAAS